jgi:hypothetical protein
MLIMVCGSHTNTVATTIHRPQMVVDLTVAYSNRSELREQLQTAAMILLEEASQGD